MVYFWFVYCKTKDVLIQLEILKSFANYKIFSKIRENLELRTRSIMYIIETFHLFFLQTEAIFLRATN